ncbi:MAG: rod shape-determining protein MreC [Phycisphaerae bacterium]|nr:rod shape-determining protein MreC [Phycisphaerae bacterium]
MGWLRDRLNKPVVFVALMIFSIISLLLPRAWSDALKHVTQLLVPAQDLVFRSAVRVSNALPAVRPDGADATAASAADAKRAIENQLVFQSGLIDELRRENQQLRGLRALGFSGEVRLVPARVVARDIVAARDSVLVGRGGFRGARWQDWVTSRVFLDQGAADGVEQGCSVLAREFLVGRIESVSPYMARVRLLTDVDSRVTAQIGRMEEGRFEAVDYACTLHGRGHGRMEIEDVPLSLLATGPEPVRGARRARRIRVDDVVASAAGQFGLPAPMVIGRVVAWVEDPRKRLVATVQVEPAVRPDSLSDIFIVATGQPQEGWFGGAPP